MYRYGNVNFKLDVENKKILKQLEEIFYPHICLGNQDAKVDFIFKVSENKEEYFNIEEEIKGIEGERLFVVKCSKKKGEIILSKFQIGEKVIYKYIEKNIILTMSGNCIVLYYLEKDISYNSIYKGIFIILEHFIQKYANLKGGVLVHASAIINSKGKVVLFIGEKRSGKTTFFIESCIKKGAIPLSVDKVYLFLSNNSLEVRGFPSRLRILAGTLSKYKELQHLIPIKYQNVSSDILWEGHSDSKVSIEIKKFEDIINRKFITKGKLEKIIFPKLRKNEKFKEKILLEQEILERIDKCIYTPYNQEEDWWSDIGKEEISKIICNRNKLIKELSININVIEIIAGEDIEILPIE